MVDENGTVPFAGAVKQLLFWDRRGLGEVRLLSPQEFAGRCGPDRIGPDALAISVAQLRERLGASRRAIKVALLDQRALAGIGNIYASEILHRAGIHPAQPCLELAPRQWTRLRIEMRRVLREALRDEGSTLGDRTFRNARGGPGRFCRHVYQRDGQACLRCGRAEIVRIVQAQRSTFFCPACQVPSPSGRRSG